MDIDTDLWSEIQDSAGEIFDIFEDREVDEEDFSSKLNSNRDF